MYLNIKFNIALLGIVMMLALGCGRNTSQTTTQQTPEAKEEQKQEMVKETMEKGELPEEDFPPVRHQDPESPDTVFMLQKTACYGKCPVFTATILSNGTMKYTGKRNVDKVGQYTSKISRIEISKIDRELKRVDILSFAEHYPLDRQDIVDAANTIIYTQFDGESKRIFINHGAPDELKRLINKVERILEEANWEKGNSNH